jgi:hypothetical protein
LLVEPRKFFWISTLCELHSSQHEGANQCAGNRWRQRNALATALGDLALSPAKFCDDSVYERKEGEHDRKRQRAGQAGPEKRYRQDLDVTAAIQATAENTSMTAPAMPSTSSSPPSAATPATWQSRLTMP